MLGIYGMTSKFACSFPFSVDIRQKYPLSESKIFLDRNAYTWVLL